MKRGPFRSGRRHEPTPPENVRLVLTDGTEIPVDCVFVKFDQVGGTAIWRVVTNIRPGTVAQMKVDVLPGRTTIEFPVAFVEHEGGGTA